MSLNEGMNVCFIEADVEGEKYDCGESDSSREGKF